LAKPELDPLKRLVKAVADIALAILAIPSASVLWLIRRVGLLDLPLSRSVLMRIGLLPVRRHYYEPFVSSKELIHPLTDKRSLPGIDWNLEGQLSLLGQLRYADEISDLPKAETGPLEFYYDNPSFKSGDAEFLYQLIRLKKPGRILEVGSGYSTLMAHRAIQENRKRDANYRCTHQCIEPYEMPWLESLGIEIFRQRVENVDLQKFRDLSENDLLFIDSSHVIRPQGDVVTLYLKILPILNPGVIVHIHDIFSPRDYPNEWVIDRAWLWNEQYLLEAFLSQNDSWQIIAALNFLKHEAYDELQKICPRLTPDREPGSFYMQRFGRS
jgi:hypothetical protein